LVVTSNPEYASQFEATMKGNKITRIGVVREDDKFVVNGRGGIVINTNITEVLDSYKSTFEDY